MERSDSRPRPANPADSHSSEEALRAARRVKAEQARARGENPFANDLDPSPLALLSELRGRFAAAKKPEGTYDKDLVAPISDEVGEVHVAGRVVFQRGFGKATFFKVRDRSGEMQLFCRQDGVGPWVAGTDETSAFERVSEIDLADHVEAVGKVIVTKTGELTVDVARVRLITKALLPPPDKWHGLHDVETRYRQRYVDLIANHDARDIFKARSLLVRAVRRYLDGEGFLEVETPTLHTLIGGAAAKPFDTHHNALDMHLFLRIAPELFLKRLLVGGLERVYEIGRAYRNEGISTRHNPEFTMLEFYEAYATYDRLMVRTEGMLRAADAALAEALPEQHAAWSAARPFTIAEPFARVPMKEAVERALATAGLPPDVLTRIREEAPPIKEWAQKSERAKKRIDWGNFRRGMEKCENDGEALFSAYEYLAEPFLADDYRSADGTRSLPVFVMDYPFETSPLARRKDRDPSLVDRFELFVHGRELCNAFSELNDPDDQAERFKNQVEKKSRGAEETMDYDADYIRALEHGMPPAAGFGMGVDRLVMMLTNAPSIRDVILFPLLRPEQA
jgi:lysyl-tRNA synthetase class 2